MFIRWPFVVAMKQRVIMNKKVSRRGQPRKTVLRKPVRLSLLPRIRMLGDKLAFAENKSLSRFLEDLIQERAGTKKAQTK